METLVHRLSNCIAYTGEEQRPDELITYTLYI